MIRFLLLLLLLPSLALAQPQSYPGPGPVLPTPVRVLDVKSLGATGNGVTDDSAVIAAAMSTAIAQSGGVRTVVYLPAGSYYLKATTLPLINKSLEIRGDGLHKTYIKVDPTYVGDVFAASEVWSGPNYVDGMSPSADTSGLMIRELTIMGNIGAATGVQNAIALYDREDLVLVDNVDVYYLNGACLKMGVLKNLPESYTRESLFSNLRCFNTGTTTQPAVDVSSFTELNSDATNEVRFVNLHILGSAGIGLQVRNPNNFSATRLTEFVATRVESSALDNIRIGSATDAGIVNNIHFHGLESISPGTAGAGHFAFNLDTAGVQGYDVVVVGGAIGPCPAAISCNGVNVGNFRLGRLDFGSIGVTGTAVTYAANAGGQVVVGGNGIEQFWTYNINAAAYKLVQTPLFRYGNPTNTSFTDGMAIGAAYHDGSSTYGNALQPSTVDLQIVKTSANNIPTGQGSALIGGSGNSITSNPGNAMIAGGSFNTISAADSFIGGGIQATDRGRNSQPFAVGFFSTLGDAQAVRTVLSQTCASCAAAVLATAHQSANVSSVLSIGNGQSYNVSARCVARDVTTAGTDLTTTMPLMLLSRDANAASTLLALGTPVSVSRGTWTGGSFAFTADTTLGALKVAFTSPTSNTDTFHAVCDIQDVETQ